MLFLYQQWASPHPFSLYLLLFFLFLFVVWFYKPNQNTKYNLPPSPWKLPIIGNIHQLHDRPHKDYHSLAKKYGPLMFLYIGRVPTLVVSNAEMAREIMKTYDHIFCSRCHSTFAQRLVYGKDMAFQPYNEYWRQVRKVCVLQLLSAKKVQSIRFVREEEVACMIEKIKVLSSSSLPMNMREMFIFLTNNIVCRVALGRKYAEEEVGGSRVKAMLEETGFLLGTTFNVGDFIPSLAWVNNFNGLNARVEKNFQELDSFLDGVVEQHLHKKKKKKGNGNGSERDEEDLVDILIGIEKEKKLGVPFARDNIKAVVLDMFAAGTDTTAVALEWAMAELIKHPEVMKEVQEEVRGIAKGKPMITEDDNIESMHYLKSAIKETLRLHPSIPLISLESIEHTKLQGYDIPAKTTVIVNAYSVGRDPKAWDKPDKFWPMRFMSGHGSLIDYKGLDFELIPFGAGRRGCPGITFAVAVLELTLANLVNMFDFGLPDGMECKDLDMDEGPGIAVHKKDNLVVIATPQYA